MYWKCAFPRFTQHTLTFFPNFSNRFTVHYNRYLGNDENQSYVTVMFKRSRFSLVTTRNSHTAESVSITHNSRREMLSQIPKCTYKVYVLSNFNQKWRMLTNFCKNPKYEILRKSVRCQWCCFMKTNG